MNDYGFDYLGYIMNMSNNIKANNIDKNYSKMPQILDPYQSFIKGNSFNNEYIPYKNYTPSAINPTNEKEALYYQLLQYNFILRDLDLYLDTNGNKKEVVELYNKYLDIKKQIQNKYESMYGAISLDSKFLDKTKWSWIDAPWPWEGV